MNDPRDSEAARLFDAALSASQAGQGDAAIALWRQYLRRQPAAPLAHYLLGAEHAQAQQYGDAVLHLSLAVEQAPQLAAARLQLGLLWLTLKAPGHSAAILAPLLAAPEADSLRHFAQGIAALGQDALAQAAQSLRAGLALPGDNAALAADMRKLLDRTEAALAEGTAATTPEPSAAAPEPPSHDFLISTYTANTRH